MKRLILFLALTGCCAAVAAQRCKGLPDVTAASSAMQAVFKALLDSSVACDSIGAVFDRATNRKRTGGRRLETDRPFDATAAQANLEAALRDPAVKARIDHGRARITDPITLLAYEAAVFDEEGFYAARDLRVQQLQQKAE